jgi:hypothetical protein
MTVRPFVNTPPCAPGSDHQGRWFGAPICRPREPGVGRQTASTSGTRRKMLVVFGPPSLFQKTPRIVPASVGRARARRRERRPEAASTAGGQLPLFSLRSSQHASWHKKGGVQAVLMRRMRWGIK